MNHHPRAKLRRINVRPPSVRRLTPIGVHVLVVCLKEPDGQMMVQPRRLIVHATAQCRPRAPLVGLIVGAVDQRCVDQPVHERSNVFGRKAKNDAAGHGHESIVVPLAAHAICVGILIAPLVLGKFRLYANIPIEEVGAA